MPLYEYQCRKCGKVFEVLQKFSDAPLETHEGCGGAVERLLSAPAFHLKGSGWYVTDYAKKGSGSDGEKTSDKPKDSKDGDGSKSDGEKKTTEAKPAAETKSEPKPAG